jgi:hypothetical protein
MCDSCSTISGLAVSSPIEGAMYAVNQAIPVAWGARPGCLSAVVTLYVCMVAAPFSCYAKGSVPNTGNAGAYSLVVSSLSPGTGTYTVKVTDSFVSSSAYSGAIHIEVDDDANGGGGSNSSADGGFAYLLALSVGFVCVLVAARLFYVCRRMSAQARLADGFAIAEPLLEAGDHPYTLVAAAAPNGDGTESSGDGGGGAGLTASPLHAHAALAAAAAAASSALSEVASDDGSHDISLTGRPLPVSGIPLSAVAAALPTGASSRAVAAATSPDVAVPVAAAALVAGGADAPEAALELPVAVPVDCN